MATVNITNPECRSIEIPTMRIKTPDDDMAEEVVSNHSPIKMVQKTDTESSVKKQANESDKNVSDPKNEFIHPDRGQNPENGSGAEGEHLCLPEALPFVRRLSWMIQSEAKVKGKALKQKSQNGNNHPEDRINSGNEPQMQVPSLRELLAPQVAAHEAKHENWKYLLGKFRTNALYESTELGGFKYISVSEFPWEVAFWYMLLGTFLVVCVFHMKYTLTELFEETIKTNQLLRSTKIEDYSNIRNWTFCQENTFGGARPNEPLYDALFIAAWANTPRVNPDAPDAEYFDLDEDTIYFYIKTINNLLHRRREGYSGYPKNEPIASQIFKTMKDDANLEGYDMDEDGAHPYGLLFRVTLLLRKYLQQKASLEYFPEVMNTESMARYDAVTFVDTTVEGDESLKDTEATLNYPAGFAMKALNYMYLPEDSVYKTRLQEQSDKKVANVSLKLELQFENITRISSLFTESKQINTSTTDAFYYILSNATNRKSLIEYMANARNRFTTEQKITAIDHIRQLAMADIQTSDKYLTQKNLHASSIRKANELYSYFALVIDNNSPWPELAQVYVEMMVLPTLEFFTKPAVNKKDVKVTLLKLDETVECYNLELPPETQLTRVYTQLATFIANTGVGMQAIFNDTTGLVRDYREHFEQQYASWWLEPVIVEPVTSPSMRMYYKEDSQIKLQVENKYDLENTPDSQCDEHQSVRAFDCLVKCRREFVISALECSPFWVTNANITDILQCQKSCESIPPCIYTTFKGQVNAQKSGAYSTKSRELDSIFATVGNVRISYVSSTMYFLIEQQHAFKWYMWMANLGGVLEFWVGAGLLSLTHLLMFLVKQLIKRCRGEETEDFDTTVLANISAPVVISKIE